MSNLSTRIHVPQVGLPWIGLLPEDPVAKAAAGRLHALRDERRGLLGVRELFAPGDPPPTPQAPAYGTDAVL